MCTFYHAHITKILTSNTRSIWQLLLPFQTFRVKKRNFGKIILDVVTAEKCDWIVSWRVSRSCRESLAKVTVSRSFSRRLTWKSSLTIVGGSQRDGKYEWVGVVSIEDLEHF